MGYNYAWLMSASFIDLRLTNAMFQVSVAPWIQKASRGIYVLVRTACHLDLEHVDFTKSQS